MLPSREKKQKPTVQCTVQPTFAGTHSPDDLRPPQSRVDHRGARSNPAASPVTRPPPVPRSIAVRRHTTSSFLSRPTFHRSLSLSLCVMLCQVHTHITSHHIPARTMVAAAAAAAPRPRCLPSSARPLSPSLSCCSYAPDACLIVPTSGTREIALYTNTSLDDITPWAYTIRVALATPMQDFLWIFLMKQINYIFIYLYRIYMEHPLFQYFHLSAASRNSPKSAQWRWRWRWPQNVWAVLAAGLLVIAVVQFSQTREPRGETNDRRENRIIQTKREEVAWEGIPLELLTREGTDWRVAALIGRMANQRQRRARRPTEAEYRSGQCCGG